MLADVVKEYPRRFFALASISPFDGMRGVREFEHLIKERGLNGLRVAARRFDEDAHIARKAGQVQLAEQFELQAKESRELAEEIEC